MIDASQCFKQSPDVVHRRVAGESILVPIRGSVADMQHLYALDAVAEHAWSCLDGKTSVEGVAESIAELFEVDVNKAQPDLCAFLEQLLEQGLVEKG